MPNWLRALFVASIILNPGFAYFEKPCEAAPPDRPGAQSQPARVALSGETTREHGSTHITISWEGQEDPAILAVAIQGRDGAHPVVPEHPLRGLPLLRAIKSEGTTTITLDDEGARDFFHGERLSISVYVAREVSVSNVWYAKTRKRPNIVCPSGTTVRPRDCSHRFRAVLGEGSASPSFLFESSAAVEPDYFERSQPCWIEAAIRADAVIALLTFTIDLSSSPPGP